MIRFVTDTLEFHLPNPEVIEALAGPWFRVGHYFVIDGGGERRRVPHGGDFRLRDAILIEPLPTQAELGMVA